MESGIIFIHPPRQQLCKLHSGYSSKKHFILSLAWCYSSLDYVYAGNFSYKIIKKFLTIQSKFILQLFLDQHKKGMANKILISLVWAHTAQNLIAPTCRTAKVLVNTTFMCLPFTFCAIKDIKHGLMLVMIDIMEFFFWLIQGLILKGPYINDVYFMSLRLLPYSYLIGHSVVCHSGVLSSYPIIVMGLLITFVWFHVFINLSQDLSFLLNWENCNNSISVNSEIKKNCS